MLPSKFDIPALIMAGHGFEQPPKDTDALKLTLLPPSETSTLILVSETLPETLSGGPGFMEEAEPLVDEIILQRYADWGSTRDRAQRFVKLLARIMETWL